MKLSIVIASGAGGAFLAHCLDSLRDQVKARDVEVIVVDRCGKERTAEIREKYPFADVLYAELDHMASVPELRMIGVQHAGGDLVAVIEEHCIAPPNWIRTIESSFQEGDAAIGGPIVDDDYDRLMDWAVYFSEYHNYLPPWPEGEWYDLNGANIAYLRQNLVDFLDVLPTGFWEVVAHPELIKKGHFRSVNRMGVRHTGPFTLGYYLRQRYLLSRVWGGTQKERVSLLKRLIYLVLAPVLPVLIFVRITTRVARHKRLVQKYLATTPLLVPIILAYVWGEWLGYLVGSSDALEQVE